MKKSLGSRSASRRRNGRRPLPRGAPSPPGLGGRGGFGRGPQGPPGGRPGQVRRREAAPG